MRNAPFVSETIAPRPARVKRRAGRKFLLLFHIVEGIIDGNRHISRCGPGMEYATEGSLSTGTVVTVVEERDGWGRFADNRWIRLSYTKKL